MQTNTIRVPLNQLRLCPENIRQTHSEDGIEELAASIKSHGLMMPLLVRPDDPTAVIAGGRRMKALFKLSERGDMANDSEIECKIAREDADRQELSLAENTVREAMHPIDQAAAFAALVEKKITIDDIATRFGVTPTIVHKRIALARVSPKILEAFRKGDLTLSQAQAFTLRNDHAAQESAMESLSWEFKHGNVDPHEIRDALTDDDGFVRGDDDRVKFLGIDTYETAGGVVSRDLFTDGPEGAYLQDEKLLDELALKKLTEIAEEIRQSEGWSWAEAALKYSHTVQGNYTESRPKTVDLSDADQMTLDDLEKQYEEAEKLHGESEDDSEEEQALSDKMESLEQQMEAIGEKKKFWSERQKSAAGVLVYLSRNGELEIERGKVKPKVTKVAAGEKDDKKADGKKEKPEEREIPSVVEYSKGLTATLTAHKTAAIAIRMAKQPHIALALGVLQMLVTVISRTAPFGYLSGFSPIKNSISLTTYPQSVSEKGVCKGLDDLEALRLELVSALPVGQIDEDADLDEDDENPETPAAKRKRDLLTWCLSQDQDTLLRYHALCLALSVTTITEWHGSANTQDARMLMETLGVNMNEYFVPSATNFFDKLAALQILAVLKEAGVEVKDEWKGLKKKDLALLAEGEIGAHNPLWLPPALSAATPGEINDAGTESDETDDEE